MAITGLSGSTSSGTSSSTGGSAPYDPNAFNALNAQLRSQYTGKLPTGNSPWNNALGLVSQGAKPIDTNPIWNPQQIQGQVNQSNANAWAGEGGQQRELAGTLAGRGFGGNSPLYQALSTNLGAQTRNSNQQSENTLRWNAAQGNAQHVLAAQTAEGQRQQGLSGLANQLYGTDVGAAVSQQNALLAALAGLNQPRATSQSKSQQQSQSGSVQATPLNPNPWGPLGAYGSSGSSSGYVDPGDF
jgi:hypothetical protein